MRTQPTREQSEAMAWNEGYLQGARDTRRTFYAAIRQAGDHIGCRIERVRRDNERMSGQKDAA